MIGNARKQGSEGQDQDAIEVLHEMEQSTPDAVKRLRAHTRLSVRARVIVEPANMTERHTWRIQGVTGDVSEGGAQILLPRPLGVGDVFWLTFDRQELDIPPVFVRVMRARLVREDAFELGLKFFDRVELPTDASAAESSNVI